MQLGQGDYGLLPVGVPHAWRERRHRPGRCADARRPRRGPARLRHARACRPAGADLPDTVPWLDVRDPRTRRFGHFDRPSMDPGKQTQDLLAVSASMRTALLVYSGITVKMMVDSDLGAALSTMFMVQYAPDGVAGTHDHPFEETYLFLEGEAEAAFDGEPYRLGPGDAAWAGVGCVHGFRNVGAGPAALAGDPGAAAAAPPLLPVHPGLGLPEADARAGRTGMRTVVVGGTSGIGREVARHRAARGDDVVLTGREAARRGGGRGDRRGPHAASRSTSRRTPSPPRSPTSGRSTTSCSPRSTATRTPSPTTTSTGPLGS